MKNRVILQDARIYDCESGAFVRRDIIIADGHVADICPGCATDAQHVVDLNGRLLLKPFCDYHLHMPGAELYNRFGVNLSACCSVDEYAAQIRAGARHSGDIVRGFGWYMALLTSLFKPDDYLAFLDTVCPDKAVFLFSNDFHSCWCNSKAIAIIHSLGIDYVSGDAGTTCIFHEHIAKSIFEEPTLAFSDAAIEEAVIAYQDKLLGYGIAEIYSFMFIGAPRAAVLRTLAKLDRCGRLRINILCCYDVYPGQTKEALLAHIEESRVYASPRIRFRFAKLYVDGVIENHTAWLKTPYADQDTCGFCLWPLDELQEMVLFLHDMGIPIHAHAIGDLAVETMVQCLKNAVKIPYRDVITHLQVCDEVCMAAMVENSIWACFQPFWFGDGFIENGLDQQRLGDRARTEYPVAEMAAAGVGLLFASDSPVTSHFAPLKGIRAACKKIGVSRADALTLALNAYTVGTYDGQNCQIKVGDPASFIGLPIGYMDILSTDDITVDDAITWFNFGGVPR